MKKERKRYAEITAEKSLCLFFFFVLQHVTEDA